MQVLSEMATFVVEGPQCASVAALLVPYIRRKVRGGLPLTEMNRRSVLLTLSRLLPRVERPEQYAHPTPNIQYRFSVLNHTFA